MSYRWFPSLLRRAPLAALLATSLLAAPGAIAEPHDTPWHLAHGFRNLDNGYSYTLSGRALGLLRRAVTRSPQRGAPPARLANDGAALRANGTHPTVTWVGHATLLVQLAGVNVLTDPIWSNHIGPPLLGVNRQVPPGIRFQDLPRIHAVVISHDHYDHLDLPTVQRLAREHDPTFFVPLGIGAWLAERGITNVVELDWWQSRTFRGLTFTATPAQHSSGRGLLDQNERLWASWVISGGGKRLFFGGDTGYTPALAEIGRRLGPFDVAALPIGGYSAFNAKHPNHVNPEEAMQLFDDLHGRLLVPMHWGTFDMNREPFREPPTRLLAEALRRGEEERVALLSQGQSIDW
ncbi:MAG TPA: MBL fold metallo-hydrolase [Methylomirabilota bacterium]|jgi:L-ascorbate metabolism protein UlaG (beta-lactamase superfamily)